MTSNEISMNRHLSSLRKYFAFQHHRARPTFVHEISFCRCDYVQCKTEGILFLSSRRHFHIQIPLKLSDFS